MTTRDPMRRRGPHPDPAGMTSGAINKELDALQEHDDSTRRYVERGWGSLTYRQIRAAHPTDPDVVGREQRNARREALCDEVRARYGPGWTAGTRLPYDSRRYRRVPSEGKRYR